MDLPLVRFKNMLIFPAVLSATLLLASCATQQKTGTAPQQNATSALWQQHQQALQTLDRYQTRGAFALLSDKQKVYARFNWQQTAPDRWRLLMINPLGNTILQLDVQKDHVQIVDKEGQRYYGNNAEMLISRLTGMHIPVNNLRQWILGLPGKSTNYRSDNEGRLREVHDMFDGQPVTVTYHAYDSKVTPSLPSSMTLQSNEQRIKLRMDNWTLQ